MHNKKDIDNIVYEVLRKSKALDIFPTPIERIVEYCELNLGNSDDFHRIPQNYFAKKKDAFNSMLKKIAGVLDREIKHIYIDPSLSNTKKNFVTLHETGHHCLPWQKHILYFDNDLTISADVLEAFEKEANYFASSGLFQLNRFDEEMGKLPLEIGSPMALAKKFGSSNHASFRRYAECSKKRCALIVLEKHPHSNINLVLRNTFFSPSFIKQFGEVEFPANLGMDFPFVTDFTRKRRLHTDGTIELNTLDGDITFKYHYFFNGYNVFVFILPVGEMIKSRTRIHITSQML